MAGKKLSGARVVQILDDMNGGRSFLANIIGFFCVAAMLGLVEMACRFMLNTQLDLILRILLVVLAGYYFLPFLILWVLRGSKS
ncbi:MULTISPECIES: hypothetical protein [Acetobacter]|uniref:Phage shock protein PspC N-terminal domain-containing protein n=1 Tax=Acetobacter thailandicus TaxID=1502842 RepID=A0ABT3QGW0_9PROT|nr:MULTISPECIES: hypothetical protein [Acetobacter]MCX2564506.1 hypothetical protein [Acetobacter thailandicus]OUI89093.1 hypothetical protein HK11_02295 [Acetobacter sp. DmW_043]OUJ09553.1 hypothetical protein HK25_11100 [Acetobacter sp. DsW_059]